MSSLDRKLLRDLAHLKGQLIAVALVVACGVATFVTMRSVYDSLLLTIDDYYGQYRFADIFASTGRTPDDVLRRIEAIPGVGRVQGRTVVQVTLDVPGLDEPATGRLISIPERHVPILNDLYLRSGRWIEPGRSDEVIVSEAFADANSLVPGDTLGAVINSRWKHLRIVGVALSPEYVYEVGGGASLFPDNRRFGIIWIGADALNSAFDMRGTFNDLSVVLARGTVAADVIERIDRVLEPYGGLGAYARPDQISHNFLSSELEQLQSSAVISPLIFLGVSAFLLHIVLTRLVGTQREQVAVLKAFGFSNWTIGFHYLKFAMTAVLAGSIVGIAAGMWLGVELTDLYTKFYRFPILRYVANPSVVVSAVAIVSISALIGALAAVRGAVRLPPAEAMRPEPPARFKPGMFERLGLQRFLSASGRMILRNVERNPFKAMLSVLGIALSVAILIVGRYSFDAINLMNDLQFRMAQREDVTVIFNNPRPSRARYDLRHLPGVLRLEPFRTVPVKLTAGHRTRRLALTGLEPGGTMHRIVDRNFHVVGLPPDGLVLTDRLGELLGVAPGDTVSVELLEGRRTTRRVPIAGFVSELLGLSAYMDLGAVSELLGEDRTISGAYLDVDHAKSEGLYRDLKRMPSVAGVAVREATLQSFEDTIAESQGMSRNSLIFFACVIAIGVIYNSARIALSERGRELASLRVLGFTKAEVALLLLGEQGVLTLVALPVGFLLGYGMCAMLSAAVQNELFRMPLVVSSETLAFSAVVVVASALMSGLLVRRRIYRLDMIEVLKTRE